MTTIRTRHLSRLFARPRIEAGVSPGLARPRGPARAAVGCVGGAVASSRLLGRHAQVDVEAERLRLGAEAARRAVYADHDPVEARPDDAGSGRPHLPRPRCRRTLAEPE